jgi:hypothetical protein
MKNPESPPVPDSGFFEGVKRQSANFANGRELISPKRRKWKRENLADYKRRVILSFHPER